MMIFNDIFPMQLPRAKAVVAAPDILSPSGPDEADEFFRTVFGTELSSGQLETWVENLREWLSNQVCSTDGLREYIMAQICWICLI